jgi:hypothetical protein
VSQFVIAVGSSWHHITFTFPSPNTLLPHPCFLVAWTACIYTHHLLLADMDDRDRAECEAVLAGVEDNTLEEIL